MLISRAHLSRDSSLSNFHNGQTIWNCYIRATSSRRTRSMHCAGFSSPTTIHLFDFHPTCTSPNSFKHFSLRFKCSSLKPFRARLANQRKLIYAEFQSFPKRNRKLFLSLFRLKLLDLIEPNFALRTFSWISFFSPLCSLYQIKLNNFRTFFACLLMKRFQILLLSSFCFPFFPF